MSGGNRGVPRRRRRRTAPGTAPGTLVTDPNAPKPEIRVIAFGPDGTVEREIAGPEEIPEFLERWPVTWVNVDGLGDVEMIRRFGEVFGLHRLALEDVVNLHQRPKVEDYGEHHFIVARMAAMGERIETEQISLFLAPKLVLTFQERRGDCFDAVRRRIREAKGRIRAAGPDYLAYALLDAIVDHYFPLLEVFGERLETLEEEILEDPDAATMGEVHRVKRDLLTLRRAIWPQREVLNTLIREPAELIGEETRIYLRDCYDHAIQIMDITETYRELAGGLVDAYLSIVSNRMNEVMKVLTIIATIFIPITFVAGIYGMNFDIMPETKWRYGYPVALAVMGLVAVVMLFFFWKRGWLGSRARGRDKGD